jgi:ASC-1-like (ASCH) protein
MCRSRVRIPSLAPKLILKAMTHIAIMKKSWNLIDKIVSGEKTIESRWYKARFIPWNRIQKGDTIFFKNSSEPVTAVAEVVKVLQYESLDETKFKEIISKYGDEIGLKNVKYNEYYKSKKYCILIFLENSKLLNKPFDIDKTGYGISTAWMCMNDIDEVKA